MEDNKEQDLLIRAKKRFSSSMSYSEEQYRTMKEDLEFLNGEQWDTALKADRAEDGRPCLVINKLPTFVDQIVGDERLNRPSIKIIPVDSGADKDTAEVLSGLIKNIEVQSNAGYAYDTAFDGAVSCGFGAFRILTDYESDLSFDQEIKIGAIENQFTVYLDHSSKEWDYSDANFLFVTEKMQRDDFEKEFPNASIASFDADRDNLENWIEGDTIRVAEYWEKEYKPGKLMLVQVEGQEKPQIVDNLLPLDSAGVPYEILKEREIKIPTIKWYRITGAEILEGPIEQPGKYFPIIPVWGKKLNIENKRIYRGVVRHSKDPQRLYNYNRSAGAEMLSLAPKAPYLATAKQIGPYQKVWDTANKKNYAYLPYVADPKAPPPQRQFAPGISTGIQQEVIVADQELHDTTGLQRSSLGKQGNEKSGKAIVARQREGDVGSYDYTNSLLRSLTLAGRVILDLIPHIYDTARVIRIIGEDGEQSVVPINQQIEAIDRAFDLSVGKYDVVVTTGPSFTTQREEMRNSMMEFLQYAPAAGPLVMDLVAKAQDWPNADEFAERLQPADQNAPKSPEEQAQMEILKEAEMRTLQAKVDQEELKAEQLELENRELAEKIKKLRAETSEILKDDGDDNS